MEQIRHQINKLVYAMCEEIGEAMIRYMSSNSVIPVDTHNMKDGVGLALYDRGVVKRFLMNPRATRPNPDVWGKDLIREVINAGATKYTRGISLVLFSSMPYDVSQDKGPAHRGWFSVGLTGEFKSLIDEVLRKYGNKWSYQVYRH